MLPATEEQKVSYTFQPKITKENLHDLIDACGQDNFEVDVDLKRMVILLSIPAK